MACILTKPSNISQANANYFTNKNDFYDSILGASTNQSLCKSQDHNINAEIGTIGQACQHGHSTRGGCAYITRAPCKRCFAAFVSTGISRIVCHQQYPQVLVDIANKIGIKMIDLSPNENKTKERVELLIPKDDEERKRVESLRKSRKEVKTSGKKLKCLGT